MLVIHWAKQNTTANILTYGLRPGYRRQPGGARKNPKGVYVYPFSTNRTLCGTWRRNLKRWDNHIANYNGFVFRLHEDDFPILAGYWFFNRSNPVEAWVQSLQELSAQFGDFFSGDIVDKREDGLSYNWEDFEIIIPKHIAPQRIIRVIRDREPRGA